MSESTPFSLNVQDPDPVAFSKIFQDFLQPLLRYDSWDKSELQQVLNIGIYLWNTNRVAPEVYSEFQTFLFQSIDPDLRLVLQEIVGSRTGAFKTYTVAIHHGKVLRSKKDISFNLELLHPDSELTITEDASFLMMNDFVEDLADLGLIDDETFDDYLRRYDLRIQKLISKHDAEIAALKQRIAENEAKMAQAKTGLQDSPSRSFEKPEEDTLKEQRSE
jgi:hypothetical protein